MKSESEKWSIDTSTGVQGSASVVSEAKVKVDSKDQIAGKVVALTTGVSAEGSFSAQDGLGVNVTIANSTQDASNQSINAISKDLTSTITNIKENNGSFNELNSAVMQQTHNYMDNELRSLITGKDTVTIDNIKSKVEESKASNNLNAIKVDNSKVSMEDMDKYPKNYFDPNNYDY